MVETYTKVFKKSVYHGAVISALAIGYNNAWKNINKDEPSIPR